MSIIRRLFSLTASKAARIEEHKSPGPFKDAPSVQMDDALFVARAMGRSKWADVEFYGPGAKNAEARRSEALGIEPSKAQAAQDKTPEPPRSSHGPKKKRGKLTMRERLRRLRQNGGA